MSYRTNEAFVQVMIMVVGGAFLGLGFAIRVPGFTEEMWWLPVAVGAVILLVSLVNIGFVATQPTKTSCPYCKEKIVPKVKMNGHLQLSRLDED
jgi:hypothetical protein